MKVNYLKSLFVAVLAVTISSCEKKAETIENSADRLAASITNIVYPLNGNDMSMNILPKKENLPDAKLTKDASYLKNKVKLIDLICEEYLEGTKKLDISKLKEGEFSKRIRANDLTINFSQEIGTGGDGFVKLDHGPNRWWAHWNYTPYTESEYPSVLFAANRNGSVNNTFDLTFDRKLTTFGFEVAPNGLGEEFEVWVNYQEESWYRQPNMIEVRQTISSPSGARLIAVKSQIPFQRVAIQVRATTGKAGVAIANIRYAVAK
jgi:hypothetical protein